MNTFQQALSEWLARDGNTQAGLADKIGKSQAAVSRYADGERFPDAETARAIADATQDEVPMAAWTADFMAKSGLAA